MLVAVGAGFVPFIGIVYSMLFVVVQFGSTTFTPRLNLFRDDPIVWHAFSFLTVVIVFALTAAFAIGTEPQTTLLIPIAVGVAVLAAIGLLRSLQAAAAEPATFCGPVAWRPSRLGSIADPFSVASPR